MATSPGIGPTSICTALRPPASSNAFPINTTESGHRHPCVLCIWKIMRSYLSAVRQDLLVRDSPSAFAKGLRDLVLCSFNYLLLSHGFLTKSSPETCTFLAARRMMSPREATLFRRGSQLANRAPRRILHHRLASSARRTSQPGRNYDR